MAVFRLVFVCLCLAFVRANERRPTHGNKDCFAECVCLTTPCDTVSAMCHEKQKQMEEDGKTLEQLGATAKAMFHGNQKQIEEDREGLEQLGRATCVPPLSKIMEARKNTVFYPQFCKTFLKCVVGDTKWRSNHLKLPMGEFVTVTDEAFALLITFNCHERWQEMWVQQNWQAKNSLGEKSVWVTPKFTNGGKNSQNGRTRKHCGWSNEGIQKFNELCVFVQQDRKEHRGFDEACLAEWRSERSKSPGNWEDDKENRPQVVLLTPMTDFPWETNKEANKDEDEDEDDVLRVIGGGGHSTGCGEAIGSASVAGDNEHGHDDSDDDDEEEEEVQHPHDEGHTLPADVAAALHPPHDHTSHHGVSQGFLDGLGIKFNAWGNQQLKC